MLHCLLRRQAIAPFLARRREPSRGERRRQARGVALPWDQRTRASEGAQPRGRNARRHGHGVIQFPVISGLRAVGRVQPGVSLVGYGNAAAGWPVSSGLISRQDNPANLISTWPTSLGDPIPRLRERSKDSAPRRPCARNPFSSRNMQQVPFRDPRGSEFLTPLR